MQPTLFNTPAPNKTTPANQMPAWLRDHLSETTGDNYHPGGTRRAAKPRPCRHCHAWCLTGLDADRCAFEAWADPLTLDANQELACLLTGRATFELWRAGGENKYELDRRDKYAISSRPPGSKRIIAVLPAHECGRPLGQPIKRKHDGTLGQKDSPAF